MSNICSLYISFVSVILIWIPLLDVFPSLSLWWCYQQPSLSVFRCQKQRDQAASYSERRSRMLLTYTSAESCLPFLMPAGRFTINRVLLLVRGRGQGRNMAATRGKAPAGMAHPIVRTENTYLVTICRIRKYSALPVLRDPNFLKLSMLDLHYRQIWEVATRNSGRETNLLLPIEMYCCKAMHVANTSLYYQKLFYKIFYLSVFLLLPLGA